MELGLKFWLIFAFVFVAMPLCWFGLRRYFKCAADADKGEWLTGIGTMVLGFAALLAAAKADTIIERLLEIKGLAESTKTTTEKIDRAVMDLQTAIASLQEERKHLAADRLAPIITKPTIDRSEFDTLIRPYIKTDPSKGDIYLEKNGESLFNQMKGKAPEDRQRLLLESFRVKDGEK